MNTCDPRVLNPVSKVRMTTLPRTVGGDARNFASQWGRIAVMLVIAGGMLVPGRAQVAAPHPAGNTNTVASLASAAPVKPPRPAPPGSPVNPSPATDLDKLKALLSEYQYDQAAALCGEHTNDPAFANLATETELKHIESIDDHLEVFQVWFGLIKPEKARSALAREPRQAETARQLADGELSIADKESYRKQLSQFESQLAALHQIEATRAKVIAQIRAAIDDHQ